MILNEVENSKGENEPVQASVSDSEINEEGNILSWVGVFFNPVSLTHDTRFKRKSILGGEKKII